MESCRSRSRSVSRCRRTRSISQFANHGSLISKPEFIKAHHNNSLSKLPSILIVTSKIDVERYIKKHQGFHVEERVYGRRAATIVYSNSDSFSFPLMPPFDGNVEFISSCNGIVCVCARDCISLRDVYLFNPLTRRSKSMFKKLPPPPFFRVSNLTRRRCSTNEVVFGFDCLSHDFKVLKIDYATTDINNNDSYKFVNVVAAHLYSLNDDSWRVIQVGIELPSLVCYPHCPFLRSGPVLDGVLYLEGVDAIITFDLHNEYFGLIKYPSFMHTRMSSVLDFEGSVALVIESVGDEKEVSLWTMEAVSDEVFWNKRLTFDAGSEEIEWFFLYSGAHKFVGRTKLGTVMYDFHKKETKIIGLPSQSFLVRVLKHTETFLSLEEFKEVEG
ncbi:hypothetical protein OROHE_003814 [Orobanche hederae]